MPYQPDRQFINRLWYGEGFDYDTPSADYWLVEMSGLPSGLSADMLRYTTMKVSGCNSTTDGSQFLTRFTTFAT